MRAMFQTTSGKTLIALAVLAIVLGYFSESRSDQVIHSAVTKISTALGTPRNAP